MSLFRYNSIRAAIASPIILLALGILFIATVVLGSEWEDFKELF